MKGFSCSMSTPLLDPLISKNCANYTHFNVEGQIKSQSSKKLDEDKYEVTFKLDGGQTITSILSQEIKDFTGYKAYFTENTIELNSK